MKKIIIGKNESGCRIDKFLVKEFFSPRKTTLRGKFTRGEIIRQIKNGNVLVNGKKVKPSYILKENDIIESKIKEQGTKNKIIPKLTLDIDFLRNLFNVKDGYPIELLSPRYEQAATTFINSLDDNGEIIIADRKKSHKKIISIIGCKYSFEEVEE